MPPRYLNILFNGLNREKLRSFRCVFDVCFNVCEASLPGSSLVAHEHADGAKNRVMKQG
ncbi:hypothetical protein SAMN02787142_3462 [Burkholderia sp. WP9]|nr:hypothetical protein SAMN02787142_3462 [Burkholderia sp. WP9]